MMRQLGVDPLHIFSIAYPDKSFSELEYANDMAAHYQTDHTVLMIEGLTMEDLEAAVYHLDEPTTDLSAIPLMLICRKSREKVIVVLSGKGGNEVFCVYDRFRAAKAAGYIEGLPGVKPLLKALASRLPDRVVDCGKQSYSLPVKNLLRSQLKPLMQELLTSSLLFKDLLQPAQVNKLMAEHLAGTHNHNHVLWALMNAVLWHRRFFNAA